MHFGTRPFPGGVEVRSKGPPGSLPGQDKGGLCCGSGLIEVTPVVHGRPITISPLKVRKLVPPPKHPRVLTSKWLEWEGGP